MKLILVLLIIAILVGLWVMGSYNNFLTLRNKTEEAFSTMDVSLKKRYDLIPNLVQTVQGYASHESNTLQAVINARNSAMGATSPEDQIAKDNNLTQTLRSLFALVENYPDLKANEQFLTLQKQLSGVEEEIAGSRRYYNGVVNKYNTTIEMFPARILANYFGFLRRPLYEVGAQEERENVTVSFNNGGPTA